MVDRSSVSGYDGLDHKLRDQPGRTHNGVNLGLNFLFYSWYSIWQEGNLNNQSDYNEQEPQDV